jgi:stage V sporulation protein G
MPSRKAKDGIHFDIAHPINKETRQMMEQKIMTEYKKITAARVTV